MRFKVVQRSNSTIDPETGLGIPESWCGHKHRSLETAYKCWQKKLSKRSMMWFKSQIIHEDNSSLTGWEDEELNKVTARIEQKQLGF